MALTIKAVIRTQARSDGDITSPVLQLQRTPAIHEMYTFQPGEEERVVTQSTFLSVFENVESVRAGHDTAT